MVWLEVKAINFRQNLKILVMFLIVQFLGLWLAVEVYSGAQVVQAQSAPVSQSVSYLIWYMLAIVVMAGVIFFILAKTKSRLPFIALEALAVGGASFIVFLVLAGVITNTISQSLYASSLTIQDYAAIAAAAILVIAKNKWPRLRNTASIIASAGLGFIIGVNLSFFFVYVFMVLLAVYDFIAVFVTKHMVVMGRAMYNMNLAFLIGTTEAEAVPRNLLSKDEVAKAPQHRAAFEKHKELLADLDRKKMVPIVANRGLGNGDLAVPLMVSVAAYRLFWSFTASLVVVLGATFGLIATFAILNRYRRDLPAIPPLLFGISIALALYFIAIGIKPF